MNDMEKVRELVEGGWEHDKPKLTSHVLYLMGTALDQEGSRFGIVWDPIKREVRRISRWEHAT